MEVKLLNGKAYIDGEFLREYSAFSLVNHTLIFYPGEEKIILPSLHTVYKGKTCLQKNGSFKIKTKI